MKKGVAIFLIAAVLLSAAAIFLISFTGTGYAVNPIQVIVNPIGAAYDYIKQTISATTVSGYCTEVDGGLEYNVPSGCTYMSAPPQPQEVIVKDTCLDNFRLKEYYCGVKDSRKTCLAASTKYCQYGCSKNTAGVGFCNPKPASGQCPPGYTRKTGFELTAYCDCGCTKGATCTKSGTLAVDTSVIALGRVVLMPDLGLSGRAEDTGGAVDGNVIDIWMSSCSAATQFGKKTNVVVCVGPLEKLTSQCTSAMNPHCTTTPADYC